jgi:hypothetical protein
LAVASGAKLGAAIATVGDVIDQLQRGFLVNGSNFRLSLMNKFELLYLFWLQVFHNKKADRG